VGFLLAGASMLTGVSSACRTLCSSESISQRIHQRLQLHATGTHPFGQGGARDFQAGTAERAFLTVQRQMVGILGHQHRASRPAVGMPLSITCGGTGAWINVSQLSQSPFAPDVRSTWALLQS
jgi:hypothetical protein